VRSSTIRCRRTQTTFPARRGTGGPRIIDLAQAREARRLDDFRRRLGAVQETNRRALSQLFQTGLIFSRAGARLGRDLLQAHQHLLKAAELLDRLGELSGKRDGSPRTDALAVQVQALLARTSELSARSDGLLARRR
jgi:hypothetical protein